VTVAPDDGRGDDDEPVRALREELAAARAESAERWAAIERLAPAAKALRLRAHQQAEVLAALRAHLDALPPAADETALATWREAARRLLDGGDIE
jgi:ribosome-binding ATPase YchF (GTP1/OBG family)